ncbi:unnamed protein product [Cyprideis torosa]|uniref:Uncharacterized protein n=1 Tax=Cyprideis torosa TaxID=163714 RepID=A0A7R8WLY5_9CRUS|nr:unnamed protein product [Cyprideis torosa]CAG0904808.1 unnamed protein product [Cyprideis torosa]
MCFLVPALLLVSGISIASSSNSSGGNHTDQDRGLKCPPYFTLVRSKCYHVGPHYITWAESVAYCRSINCGYGYGYAKLAEFPCPDQLYAVILEFLACQYPPEKGDRCFWLGAEEHRYHDSYASFRWISTGTPIVYNSWAPGRPDTHLRNSAIEICTIIMYNFYDISKTYCRYPLCEADPIYI